MLQLFSWITLYAAMLTHDSHAIRPLLVFFNYTGLVTYLLTCGLWVILCSTNRLNNNNNTKKSKLWTIPLVRVGP